MEKKKPNALKKILQFMKRNLFPHTFSCISCGCEVFGENDFQLCEYCKTRFPFNDGKTCKRCGCGIAKSVDYCMDCTILEIYFKKAVSSLEFKGNARRLILKMKYAKKRYLANIFAQYLVHTYILSGIEADCVVVAPMYKKKKKSKPFYSPQEMAEKFSQILNIEFLPDALQKIKPNRPQKGLTKEERKRNVKDCYAVDNVQVKGKTVLLIDDVKTSSATLNECSRILLKGKAKEVYCLTLASVNDS